MDPFEMITGVAFFATFWIIGWTIVSWKRSKYRYELAKMAIEKGMTEGPVFVEGPPMWLLSARQGMMLMVVGLGLMVGGWIVFKLPMGEPYIPTVSGISGGRAAATGPAAATAPSAAELRVEARAYERWRSAEQRRMLVYCVAGAGGILLLLGAARLGFAILEKRYTREAGRRGEV